MAKKKKKPEAEYYVGAWKGRSNYTCMLCPMQSLDEEYFAQHMRKQHGIEIVIEPDPAPDEPEEPAEVDK